MYLQQWCKEIIQAYANYTIFRYMIGNKKGNEPSCHFASTDEASRGGGRSP